MKILHLLGDRKLPRDPEGEGTSGVVRAALEIARAQTGLGHEVWIASVGKIAWQSEWQGVHLIGLKAIPWARIGAGGRVIDFRQHLSYVFFTRSHAFDVVQGHMYGYMPFLSARLRIVHFHSDPFYRGNQDEGIDLKPVDFGLIRRNSDAQVAVSRFVAEELKRGLNGLGNINLVYNGIDPTLFTPQRWQTAGLHLRQDWGVKQGEVVFLFSGAIVPEKGVIHLARAFARLASNTSGIHLALAGSSGLWGGLLTKNRLLDEYDGEVRQALHPLVLSGQVHFLGKMPASEMPAVYGASDAVVIPSVWREAFGLSALEGMASGRPIVASATGGLVEIVNERNGILVPPGDESALEAAMGQLAEHPSRRRDMGVAGHDRARLFSWDIAARELDILYQGVHERKAKK